MKVSNKFRPLKRSWPQRDAQSSYTRLSIREPLLFCTFQLLRRRNNFLSAKSFNTRTDWFKASVGNYNRGSSRAICLDTVKKAFSTITWTTPVRRTMLRKTRGVAWKITFLATFVDIVHKLIFSLVIYDTEIYTFVGPRRNLRKSSEHLLSGYFWRLTEHMLWRTGTGSEQLNIPKQAAKSRVLTEKGRIQQANSTFLKNAWRELDNALILQHAAYKSVFMQNCIMT